MLYSQRTFACRLLLIHMFSVVGIPVAEDKDDADA